jgi:hypothetical protein
MDSSEEDKIREESENAVGRARELFMEIKRIEAQEDEILEEGTSLEGQR